MSFPSLPTFTLPSLEKKSRNFETHLIEAERFRGMATSNADQSVWEPRQDPDGPEAAQPLLYMSTKIRPVPRTAQLLGTVTQLGTATTCVSVTQPMTQEFMDASPFAMRITHVSLPLPICKEQKRSRYPPDIPCHLAIVDSTG
jgi:hypothetical protein